jgi:hypothetical protein
MSGQRFYGAHVVDVDGDGTNEILGEFNTCTPTCADATYIFTTYHWNGTDYVQQWLSASNRGRSSLGPFLRRL